ncbi:probable GMP synthase [glutamine-hydrolyzing] isoform X2 [Tripterygium wilfordii]|uniref:probable GMP synthase [glutamine-hydrolyzing] isoform X2 n=1 Tax=Tripterygium wilfordii TaxID=458696 RepID=UPI0018F7E67B|nr:probable GMP synthase [glutamine-hydrolyzing] isoform X2 [Tripterygium wilfordii]
MSEPAKLRSRSNPVMEPRAILGPGGNRVVRVNEELKRKTEGLQTKLQQGTRKTIQKMPQSAVRKNVSVDSTCSSDSSSTGSSEKMVVSSRRTAKRNGLRSVKVVPDEIAVVGEISKVSPGPVKRCDWITPNSDPLYIAFHDKEWGVPVRDDRKLFELLVFSQALAELSWPAILHQRDIFRKLFDDFNASSIAEFTEKKLLSLKVNGSLLLSEPKLRAVVENAKQMLKVQEEFGSFSNYCWRFVNQKPLRNGFRYSRQVQVKTPKAELISKNLMQRGFRCVGPTVIYSFMQVAGIVNDHLVTCFRYRECCEELNKNLKSQTEQPEVPTKASVP